MTHNKLVSSVQVVLCGGQCCSVEKLDRISICRTQVHSYSQLHHPLAHIPFGDAESWSLPIRSWEFKPLGWVHVTNGEGHIRFRGETSVMACFPSPDPVLEFKTRSKTWLHVSKIKGVGDVWHPFDLNVTQFWLQMFVDKRRCCVEYEAPAVLIRMHL